MYGKVIPFPRLMAWYGESGSNYRFSGKTYDPNPLSPLLIDIKTNLESAIRNHITLGAIFPKQGFNSVLLNWYRGGNDSMSWHSDDEPELGHCPFIASLSLGANRWFHIRNKPHFPKHSQKLLLEDGSLLLMHSHSQSNFQHALPKTKRVSEDRINLTFRTVFQGLN